MRQFEVCRAEKRALVWCPLVYLWVPLLIIMTFHIQPQTTAKYGLGALEALLTKKIYSCHTAQRCLEGYFVCFTQVNSNSWAAILHSGAFPPCNWSPVEYSWTVSQCKRSDGEQRRALYTEFHFIIFSWQAVYPDSGEGTTEWIGSNGNKTKTLTSNKAWANSLTEIVHCVFDRHLQHAGLPFSHDDNWRCSDLPAFLLPCWLLAVCWVTVR